MTLNPTKSLVSTLFGLGIAASTAAAILQPTIFAPTLAATGGILAGVQLGVESRRKKDEQTNEAFKVGKVFSILYETNKGIVSPDQLSYNSDITIQKADSFLKALADQQGGQPLQTEQGLIYTFPHPQNVITTLTTNANNWAQQQTQALQLENDNLKRQATNLQQALALHTQQKQAKAEPPTYIPQEPPATPPSVKKNKDKAKGFKSLL